MSGLPLNVATIIAIRIEIESVNLLPLVFLESSLVNRIKH